MSIKRGLARVQFIACHSEIVELLKQGYTVRNIYDDFIKLKKITMSYVIFAKYIRTRIKNTVEESSNIKQTTKYIPAKQQDKKEEQEIQQEKAKINSIAPKIKEKKNESIEAIQFDSYKDFI